MKSLKPVKLLFGLIGVILGIIGLGFTISGFSAVAKGYEKTDFVVVDYEITDITKKTDREKRRDGSTRRTLKYEIDYHVEYEYKYDGQTYAYETDKSLTSGSKDTQPCDIGDIDKYYINPAEPGNTEDIVAAASIFVGPILLVAGIIFGVIAIVIKVTVNDASVGMNVKVAKKIN